MSGPEHLSINGKPLQWVPLIGEGDMNRRPEYRLCTDENGMWFVVDPYMHYETAICGQPFPNRKSASEHVEYLRAILILEGK